MYTNVAYNYSFLGDKTFIPESATRSVMLRPCLAKKDISRVRLNRGPGRFELARV